MVPLAIVHGDFAVDVVDVEVDLDVVKDRDAEDVEYPDFPPRAEPADQCAVGFDSEVVVEVIVGTLALVAESAARIPLS